MNVSIIIPVYNAEKYISSTLESVLQQTYPATDIVLIDDFSKDNSLLEIKHFSKKLSDVKVIKNKRNLGVSASRNIGAKEASGEWLLFLDADDLIEPELLRNYYNYLQAHTCEAIYSEFIQIDENGKTLSSSMTGNTLSGTDGFCSMLLRNPIISPTGCLVKKEIFLELGGFDEQMWSAEDVDFWLRLLLANCNIGHIKKPLSLIRRHSNNTTNSIDVTNIGENTLLEKYDLEQIRKYLYKRNIKHYQKDLDYVNFLIRYEKYKDALILLEEMKLSNDNSSYNSYLFLKSIVNIHFENLNEAEQNLNEIILLNPKHGAAYNNKGIILALKNQKKEAEKYFLEALACYPDYLDAKYNLQQLHLNQVVFKYTLRELRKNLLRYN